MDIAQEWWTKSLRTHKKKAELKRLTSLTQEQELDGSTMYVSVPYFGNLTKRLGSTLKKFGIKLAYSNQGKLSDGLLPLKDKLNDNLMKSGIYRLQCQDCTKSYIGQTKRKIVERRNEHLEDCFKPANPDSAMAFHCISEEHSIQQAKLLNEVDEPYKLNSWESLFLHRYQSTDLANLIKFGNSPSILFKYGNLSK